MILLSMCRIAYFYITTHFDTCQQIIILFDTFYFFVLKYAHCVVSLLHIEALEVLRCLVTDLWI
jgi:hypothetical protein